MVVNYFFLAPAAPWPLDQAANTRFVSNIDLQSTPHARWEAKSKCAFMDGTYSLRPRISLGWSEWVSVYLRQNSLNCWFLFLFNAVPCFSSHSFEFCWFDLFDLFDLNSDFEEHSLWNQLQVSKPVQSVCPPFTHLYVYIYILDICQIYHMCIYRW
jgi:hypothetical protein